MEDMDTMKKINTYEFMKNIADSMINAQEIKPEDFVNAEGLLVCGVCGELRQKYKDFANPSEAEPDRRTPILTTSSCRCDRERRAEQEKKEQYEKDLIDIQDLRKASLMDEKFQMSKFEKLQVTQYNEKNLKLCKRYAENFDKMLEKNQGLLFWGGVGTGKTLMASCIANHLLYQKIPVVMTSFIKILEAVQGDREAEMNIVNKLSKAKLVIFDDLGAERSTDYALEKVYNIIDTRYRQNLPIIVTTNLSMDEMKNESEIRYSRIYDRIFEICYPMQFTGPSWRKKAAYERFNEMEKFLNGDF